jgi:hypothetical protein
MWHDQEALLCISKGFERPQCGNTGPKPKTMHNHDFETGKILQQPWKQSARVGKTKSTDTDPVNRKGFSSHPKRLRGIAANDLIFDTKFRECGDGLPNPLGGP